MGKRRQPGTRPPLELLLFHGTRAEYIDAICQQGFDWRLSGTSTGTLYGKGSYFARDARYSKDYGDGSRMFVVKVLVGDWTKGNPSMVRPPPRDPTDPKILYDSTVDNVINPAIYVVYDKQQCYPEYLIEY